VHTNSISISGNISPGTAWPPHRRPWQCHVAFPWPPPARAGGPVVLDQHPAIEPVCPDSRGDHAPTPPMRAACVPIVAGPVKGLFGDL
jgi:hypothetical protein